MQLADSHTSTQPLLPNYESMLNANMMWKKQRRMGKDAAFILSIFNWTCWLLLLCSLCV